MNVPYTCFVRLIFIECNLFESMFLHRSRRDI
nr:MAG TPA: hypothetical protein [Caudoviricetes sp.]